MTNGISMAQIRKAAPEGAAVRSEFFQDPSRLRLSGIRAGLSMRDTEFNILPGPSDEMAAPRKRPPAFAPLLYADWMRAVFMHFEVEPELLQRQVPFALDLWQGRAFVSLVAFTMERLRPRIGGRLGELAF